MGDIVNYDPESDVYEVHYDDGELVSVLPMSSDGLRASMACHKRGLSEHRQGALAWRAMPCWQNAASSSLPSMQVQGPDAPCQGHILEPPQLL